MRLSAKIAAAVLLLDQISKYIVVHILWLDRVLVIDVFPPWFNLRMAWNRGVNFGLFAGSDQWTRWGLIVLALGISAVVWRWAQRSAQPPLVRASVGLLIGGALGNVIDRVFYGAVVDFLNMGFPGFSNPYSFNVADVAIFLGAMGLVFFPEEAKPRAKRAKRG